VSPLDVLVIIPARIASERFPGKPLKLIRGPDGSAKPLIEWTWRAGVAAVGQKQVIVSTDDPAIAMAARNFGAQTVITSSNARNGTERCAETLDHLDGPIPSLVINLQGDSPLIPPYFIKALVEKWQRTKSDVLTAYVQCDQAMSDRITADFQGGIVSATTLVATTKGEALYFSKVPIPFRRTVHAPLKMHVGLYAYTPEALHAYRSAHPTELELEEGLEQLRFFELGIPIQAVEVALPKSGLWEVNNPADVPMVEAALRAI
jgi:3-deoxy-manno-octulosonate cytidylyltransferase (CMP-KDO synthetase)